MAIKKRKKGRQKSKAAQATAQLKANREDEEVAARGISSDYKGGVMTRMRGGFQSAVGQSEDKGKECSEYHSDRCCGRRCFLLHGSISLTRMTHSSRWIDVRPKISPQ